MLCFLRGFTLPLSTSVINSEQMRHPFWIWHRGINSLLFPFLVKYSVSVVSFSKCIQTLHFRNGYFWINMYLFTGLTSFLQLYNLHKYTVCDWKATTQDNGNLEQLNYWQFFLFVFFSSSEVDHYFFKSSVQCIEILCRVCSRSGFIHWYRSDCVSNLYWISINSLDDLKAFVHSHSNDKHII